MYKKDQDQLLAQLRPVFRDHGYEGATLNKLATATGLGKASLYHHFPGGKAEIAATLLRQAVAQLEKLAFSRLGKRGAPAKRLQEFVDGFVAYTDNGESPCVIAAFSQGGAWLVHGPSISEQFRAWGTQLAGTLEEVGYKPKRAQREASALLANLYGDLLLAKLHGEPRRFRQGIKRIKKNLPA